MLILPRAYTFALKPLCASQKWLKQCNRWIVQQVRDRHSVDHFIEYREWQTQSILDVTRRFGKIAFKAQHANGCTTDILAACMYYD